MTDEDDDTLRIDPDPPAETPTMEEALDQLAHEVRGRILLELGADSEGVDDLEGTAYSELMERVGVEDSGRFNYHLDRMVGGLVHKEENGYWLSVNGHLVYQALVAGTLTADDDLPSLDVDGECPDCGGALDAEYLRSQVLFVECDDCGQAVQHLEFPARGLEGRSGTEALEAAIRYFNTQYAAMRRGVCPACAGRVRRNLRLPEEISHLSAAAPQLDAWATLECEACSLERAGSPDAVALTTPSVVGFLDERGVDPYGVSVSEIEEYATDVTVYEEPPIEAAVTYRAAGDELTVRLDDSLDIVDVDRP